MTSQKVCVELLKKELETPIATSKQGWRILERMASCFVAVSQDVHTMGNEVYGNGKPGGLKLQVALTVCVSGNWAGVGKAQKPDKAISQDKGW